jgi:hypothetical protein
MLAAVRAARESVHRIRALDGRRAASLQKTSHFSVSPGSTRAGGCAGCASAGMMLVGLKVARETIARTAAPIGLNLIRSSST